MSRPGEPCLVCGYDFEPECPLCDGLPPGSMLAATAEFHAAVGELGQRLRESTSSLLRRLGSRINR